MTNIRNALMQAAGTAASGDPVYVEDVFSTHLYTGTGSDLAINNGLDLSGEGGLVWVKSRVTRGHSFYDTVRGTNSLISSNNTNGAATVGQYITYNNNGFTLTSQNNDQYSGEEYCSWTFRKQEGFFDVVTYTGDGTSARTISHNLGCKPGMIMVKRTDSSADWRVWHRYSQLSYSYGVLNSTAGFTNTGGDNAAFYDANGNASNFTLGQGSRVNDTNENGATYIAYLFAGQGDSDSQIFGDDGDEAIIKCGYYTTDGTGVSSAIDIGFEPQWMIAKRSDSTSDWILIDNMRGWPVVGSGTCAVLEANDSAAESTSSMAINSKGFEDQGCFDANTTIIYMAIRRGPMKEPSAGTDVYNYQTRGGGGSGPPAYIFPHPVDWFLQRELGGTDDWYTSSRLIQGKYLKADEDDATTNSTFRGIFDFQNGFADGAGTASSQIAYAWRRYPKVFDVVAYAGGGGNDDITHNLGVTPELIIVKATNAAESWAVQAASPAYPKVAFLDTTSAFQTNSQFSAAPTATVFKVANSGNTNQSGYNYVALLFASLDGISKVGTYTGTGSAINVDCGFSGGARWVMVKRTDASADWYIVSSGRGFGKHLKVDSDADESSTAVLDTLSAGFTVRSDAGNDLNANGGTYIYLAFS